MTSKLFHTVVGIGIALGAMTMGCAAEPSTESSGSSEAAQTYGATDPAPTTPATDAGASTNDKDRFCEVAWPTTKGGPRPARAQACIDPNKECGVYPGGIFSQDQCTYGADVNSCDFDKPNVWMFCKATDKGPQWTCPTGTIAQDQCVAPPDPAPTTAPAPPTNTQASAGQ